MKKLSLKSKENSEEERSNKSESDLEFIINNLQIDKFKLDDAAVKQIELFNKISKILPKAREAALRAKNRLEIIESELSKEMRKNPKLYGLDKTSDTVITKEVKNQDTYKRAFSAYCFAKAKEDEFSITLNNIQERGRMIKLLYDMWVNSYYVDNHQFVTKKKHPLKTTEDY